MKIRGRKMFFRGAEWVASCHNSRGGFSRTSGQGIFDKGGRQIASERRSRLKTEPPHASAFPTKWNFLDLGRENVVYFHPGWNFGSIHAGPLNWAVITDWMLVCRFLILSTYTRERGQCADLGAQESLIPPSSETHRQVYLWHRFAGTKTYHLAHYHNVCYLPDIQAL